MGPRHRPQPHDMARRPRRGDRRRSRGRRCLGKPARLVGAENVSRWSWPISSIAPTSAQARGEAEAACMDGAAVYLSRPGKLPTMPCAPPQTRGALP